MSIEVWFAFVAASAVLLIIPGPTIVLVMSYGLGQGWRAALPMAAGVALGDFTAMSLSMLGIGALLAASASLFAVVKLAGAAYLVWLGVRLWRAGGTFEAQPRDGRATAVRMIGHAWLVTALNPKSITFFVAFLPQFIDGDTALPPQMAMFVATFVTLSFLNALAYGLIASKARAMAADSRAVGLFNKTGGALLIGAGLATATLQGSKG